MIENEGNKENTEKCGDQKIINLEQELIKCKIENKELKNKLIKHKIRESLYTEYLNNDRIKYSKIPKNNEPRIINYKEDKNYILDEPIVKEISIPVTNSNKILANAHYDKAILNNDEAKEVIAYIYNYLLQEPTPENAFSILQEKSEGIPNTFLTKLLDTIGEFIYGSNNYIGPSKTGYAIDEIGKVITEVPAINEVDRLARVHDLATMISDDQKLISQDLPQPIRLLTTTFANKIGYSRNNAKERLKLSGDIEENPGPKITMLDKMKKVIKKYRKQHRKIEKKIGDNVVNRYIIKNIIRLLGSNETLRRIINIENLCKKYPIYREIDFQYLLLTLAGDVELNPGPPKRLLSDFLTQEYNQLCWYIYALLGYDCEYIANDMIRKCGLDESLIIMTDIYTKNRGKDIMSADLIKMLLQRGCVELNPGPPMQNNNDEFEKPGLVTTDKVVTGISRATQRLGKRVVDTVGSMGAVKQNKYSFHKPGAEMDLICDIASNPVKSTSYLTMGFGNDDANLFAYLNDMYGQVPLRSATDNITDIAMPSSNNVMITGFTALGTGANDDQYTYGDRLFRYSLQNREVRQRISSGTLGVGLEGAYKVMTDFLAVGRTNTNAFSGDPMLQISSRIVAADYGNYVNLAKLLAYTSLSEIAWTDILNTHVPNYKTKDYPISDRIESVFPGTYNGVEGSTKRPVINCWWMNQTMLSEVILGENSLPNNIVFNDIMNCAFIPINRGYTLEAIALITMCYLEYPFFSPALINLNGATVQMNATGTKPSTTAASVSRFATEQVLIDGPKYNIIYITTDNSTSNFQIAPALYCNDINNAGTDIYPTLGNFCDDNISTNVWGGYAEAMDYFLKLANADDWISALILGANLIKARSPYQEQDIQAGALLNSYPMWSIGPNFTNNASTVIELDAGPGRFVAAYNFLKYVPMYNSFGTTDTYNPRPHIIPITPENTPDRQANPINCFVQDNQPLVNWGILTGVLKKDVLSSLALSENYKSNRRPLVYAMHKIFEIVADMAADWYIDHRVINKMLYDQSPKITDRRIPLIRTLAKEANDWQRALAGIPFMRCGSTQLAVNTANLNQVNWGDEEAWLMSPIVLSNKWMYDNKFSYKPEANIILANIYKDKWEQSYSSVYTFYGFNTGGVASQDIPEQIMYKGTANGNIDAENMYALSRVKHYADAVSMFNFLQVYIVDKALKRVNILMPIIQYWSELLACSSNDLVCSNFLIARPGLVTTIPYYPAEYDPENGLRYLIGISSVGNITQYTPCLSIEGLGSATAQNTDSYTAPGDEELVLAPGSDVF